MSPQPLDVFACPLDGISLIEASAGTGKTWNLCGLYLRLLLERRLEVQQILVVTFTNAATAELRERIRSRIVETFDQLRGVGVESADPFVANLLKALRKEHGLDDDDMRRRLDSALQSFDEAAIFTIHGFCQRALGDLPFVAGMPMALELIVDDTELRLAAVHDFWRRRLAGDALAPALARHLLACQDSPAYHAELLQKVLAKPLSRVLWPSELDDDTAGAGEAFTTGELEALYAAARATWLGDRAAIIEHVGAGLFSLHKTTYRADYVAEAILQWDRLFASDDALAIPSNEKAAKSKNRLHLFGAASLKPNKGKPPIRPHAFFAEAQALLDAQERHRQAAGLARLRLLRSMLAESAASLRDAKRSRRVIAFDDMLWNVHERLTGTSGQAFAASLRSRFQAALIDEFQDTDPLQFAIFKTIYGDGKAPLFLVGDPKQAIYSFRNADLHTYLQANREATATYSLADNQRSTRGLLDALNALFGANERAFMLPGLDYRPVACGAKPRPSFVDRSEPRAPLQLWTLPREADGTPLPKARARQAAIAACAAEIARLLAAGQSGEITLAGRPLAGGDIAVLVRSHAQGTDMRLALSLAGVAAVQLSDASLFESAEAEELARVLAAVLEPSRERLLRAALATEMVGQSAAEIEALGADEARLLGYVARFGAYRASWLQRGIGAALRELLAGEGVTRRLLARADGERRLTNLRHLAELLQQAAQAQPAPEALLRWLRSQIETIRLDEANQLRLESDRNLVQIVTIHKAKGLEYGIVFCPFLWDGHVMGSDDARDYSEYHDEAQRPVLDFRLGADAKETQAALKGQLTVERSAEDLRLIYVALTRAVHRCVVVIGAYLDGWNSPAESNRALANWLVAGAGIAPEAWAKEKLEVDAVEAAWRRLAEGAGISIGLAPLPDAQAAVPRPAGPAAGSLAALSPPARIAPAWWVGSYSSLAHGARHEGAAVDHDLRTLGDEALAAPGDEATVDDDDITRFPRGPDAGQCLHAVIERVDFGDPGSFAPAIEAALVGEGRHLGGPGSVPLLKRMLGRMLADVVATPLPGGFRLAEVARSRCLVELEFSLPSKALQAARLAAVLREHGYPAPQLAFGTLDGYLRGFIDLVFEHEGRFHIADWKSNHLGSTPAAYGQGAVERAMAQHGYHLQYLLYTVALHRYLRSRLPGYRYDEHFGSVLYLFVRGVRPGWRQADGCPSGVYTHRPPLALVSALSALLDPEREAA